jgi:hypothetical protein
MVKRALTVLPKSTRLGWLAQLLRQAARALTDLETTSVRSAKPPRTSMADNAQLRIGHADG